MRVIVYLTVPACGSDSRSAARLPLRIRCGTTRAPLIAGRRFAAGLDGAEPIGAGAAGAKLGAVRSHGTGGAAAGPSVASAGAATASAAAAPAAARRMGRGGRRVSMEAPGEGVG